MTIIVDTFSEVYNLIRPLAADEFWDLSQVNIVPGATYVIGRKQGIDHADLIRSIVDQVRIVISNQIGRAHV